MNIQLSNSPRKRFPLEKWAPVSVWTESLLTFGQRHLSWCHYGDIPPPPGATTGPGSQRESGRATGLSFLGIIRAKSRFLLSLYAASGQPSREVTGRRPFSENPGTSFAVTSKYCTCAHAVDGATASFSHRSCVCAVNCHIGFDKRRFSSPDENLSQNLTRWHHGGHPWLPWWLSQFFKSNLTAVRDRCHPQSS